MPQLLQRQAEELGGRIHDEDPDAGIADPAQEPVREDTRSPRVVHDDVALRQRRQDLLDRRLEVLVPAVVLDGVVLEGEALEGLRGPFVGGDAAEVRRPFESHRDLSRMSLRCHLKRR